MPRFPRLRRRRVDQIYAVANPNAGLGKNNGVAKRTFAQLREVFASPECGVEVRDCETQDLEHLDRTVDEMVRDQPKMIIVIGGDGTIQKTMSSIIKKYVAAGHDIPMVMIMGAGTVNAVRGALELLGPDPEKGRDKVFEKIRRGNKLDEIHRHILKINGEYGFISGVGLPVRFLERYYQHAPPRGFKRALQTSLWVLWNEFLRYLPPWRRRSLAHRFEAAYELWSDDALVASGHNRFSGIIASSVEQIGLGCKLTHRALEKPEHFHVVLSRMGLLRTLFNVPNMFLGAPLIGPADSELVTKVVLRFERPTPFMIDGEMYGEETGDTLVIERGPLLDIVKS